MKKKDFFEDFTKLNWIKWSKRKPEHNGSIVVRWNGKYTSFAHIFNGELISLDGEQTKKEFVNGELKIKYSKNQKEILKDLYWLEEKHDLESFEKYRNSL